MTMRPLTRECDKKEFTAKLCYGAPNPLNLDFLTSTPGERGWRIVDGEQWIKLLPKGDHFVDPSGRIYRP